MHSELRSAYVDRLHASLRRHHGADRAATERVIPDDELLDGNAGLLSEDLQYGGAHRVRHVALVSVNLQDDALLHER